MPHDMEWMERVHSIQKDLLAELRLCTVVSDGFESWCPDVGLVAHLRNQRNLHLRLPSGVSYRRGYRYLPRAKVYEAMGYNHAIFSSLFPFTVLITIGIGMEWTGLYSIWFQQGWLVLGLLCFFLPLLPIASIPELVMKGAVWGFLGCLIMSRVGLWSFDLAERQIMQEFVPEEKRGIINSVEFSLTNVFSLLSYFLGVVWSRPEQFGVIVIISFTSVTLAAVFYSLWMYCVRPRVVQEQNAPVREDEEAFL